MDEAWNPDPEATPIISDEEWEANHLRIQARMNPRHRAKEAFLYYFYGAIAILILVVILVMGHAIGAPIFNPGKPPGTP